MSCLRNDLLPDPRHDSVHCIVLSVAKDVSLTHAYHRIFVFHPNHETVNDAFIASPETTAIQFYSTENDLFQSFIKELVQFDPDIIVAFEMQKVSLGYLRDRARIMDIHLLKFFFDLSFCKVCCFSEISKMPIATTATRERSNAYHEAHSVGMHCPGRILLNVWRILRHEIKLNIYTFENCAAEILKMRLPKVQHATLHGWFLSSPPDFSRCLQHIQKRTETVLAMLDHLDVIGRSAEMARIYGVDFFSVLSRGSQYRVESMLVR